MNASLKARLVKLETRFAARDAEFPVVVFGESNRVDVEIVGVGNNGKTLVRGNGETVDALVVRGGRVLRQKILFLTYAAGRAGDVCVAYPKAAS